MISGGVLAFAVLIGAVLVAMLGKAEPSSKVCTIVKVSSIGLEDGTTTHRDGGEVRVRVKPTNVKALE